ncbi:hypothetical protein NHG31_08600, partial [Aerococcaceae bacterium NML171108]|nr:hypothetical protein [Aerococcaceae bacterium NML171108]
LIILHTYKEVRLILIVIALTIINIEILLITFAAQIYYPIQRNFSYTCWQTMDSKQVKYLILNGGIIKINAK